MTLNQWLKQATEVETPVEALETYNLGTKIVQEHIYAIDDVHKAIHRLHVLVAQGVKDGSLKMTKKGFEKAE